MGLLEDLAGFLTRHGDAHAKRSGLATSHAVRMILDSHALPYDLAKRAALYGFAQEIGATEAVGFDPAWKP